MLGECGGKSDLAWTSGDTSVGGQPPQDRRIQKTAGGGRVTRASGRCRQHYRNTKGGSVCLQGLKARREAGARVKKGCLGGKFEVGFDKWEMRAEEGTPQGKPPGASAQR